MLIRAAGGRARKCDGHLPPHPNLDPAFDPDVPSSEQRVPTLILMCKLLIIIDIMVVWLQDAYARTQR